MKRRSPEGQPSFEFPGGFVPDPTAKRIPIPGEKGYLEPEFHWDEKRRIVDAEGSVYDEHYQLIEKAAPKNKKLEAEEAEMERLNAAHPEWGGNKNRLKAHAEINLSMKPGDSYESTPYPPLDN
jgi:hypothetical protein